MSNSNVTYSSTSNTSSINWGDYIPCSMCGSYNCMCLTNTWNPISLPCSTCGATGAHFCVGKNYIPVQTTCLHCGTIYNITNPHNCVTNSSWVYSVPLVLKDLKEITTDTPLDYMCDLNSADLIIPTFLSYSFMTINKVFVSLFPLVFSATPISDKEDEQLKFYVVQDIKEKLLLPNDKVKFKEITVVEITDNLDLVQLVQITKSYLNK